MIRTRSWEQRLALDKTVLEERRGGEERREVRERGEERRGEREREWEGEKERINKQIKSKTITYKRQVLLKRCLVCHKAMTYKTNNTIQINMYMYSQRQEDIITSHIYMICFFHA